MADIGARTNVLSKTTKVEVEVTSTEVVGENANRAGLEIVNASTARVYFALEKAATEKSGFFLEPGGSWDGRIGAMQWFGVVNAICSVAKSIVTITEVL